jgi:cytochrome P450
VIGGSWAALVQFLVDPIPVLEKAGRSDEPIVRFKLGALPGYLVNTPEKVAAALQSPEWPPLDRGRMREVRHWYEGGLATQTGEIHHRNRDQMWIPNLDEPWILAIGVEEATRWAQGWQDGGEIEAYEDLRRLSYSIGWRVMTGESLLDDRPGVYDSLAAGDEWLGRLVHPLGPLRWRLPTPEGIRGRRLRARLDDAINSVLADRRSNGARNDLVSAWIEAGAELGATDADLRGSVKAFFGAENLHTHVAWTFHLLGENPEAEGRLHDELDQVLGGRPPTPDDFGRLPFTRAVTMESLRLYPSVPVFFRGIVERDFELLDETIPKGSLLAFSPWVMQRDPRFWSAPERFDPDRWAPDAPKPPRFAYFPFAGGAYRCPGTGKSVREGPLVLATLAQGWRMRRPAGAPPPKPTAKWALQPDGGMPMLTEKRAA